MYLVCGIIAVGVPEIVQSDCERTSPAGRSPSVTMGRGRADGTCIWYEYRAQDVTVVPPAQVMLMGAMGSPTIRSVKVLVAKLQSLGVIAPAYGMIESRFTAGSPQFDRFDHSR